MDDLHGTRVACGPIVLKGPCYTGGGFILYLDNFTIVGDLINVWETKMFPWMFIFQVVEACHIGIFHIPTIFSTVSRSCER
jgi:hypothetical protein